MSDPNTHSSLKILMITCFPFFSYRGTPISVRSRLEVLSKLGHEVDVVAYHVGDDLELPGIKILRILNIPFIREVPVGPSLKKIFLDIFVILKTFRLLLNTRYDLIHTHEEAIYFGAIFSKIFRVRHLVDFHGSVPQNMENFGYGKYKPLIKILEFFERQAFNSSYGFISLSTGSEKFIRSINDNAPIVVIDDSQNYDLYNIHKEQLNSFKHSHSDLDGKNIVLYTGTFERYQGLDLLLAAAEIVIQNMGDTIFVLVGGRQNQINTFKESAENLGIADHLRFTGFLSINEFVMYVKTSNILISTRNTGDNPPSKIYEYLRAGKPIVATNISAHTQIINEDIAVMVDLTPESIASGILSILENPSYAKALGQKSKDFFEKNFSIEKKMVKTRNILDAVMQENI